MKLRRTAFIRNAVAVVLGLLASMAGVTCDDDTDPDCEPCDAVRLLIDRHPSLAAKIPEEAIAACGDNGGLATSRRKRWQQQECSGLTALAAISEPGWADYEARFDEDVLPGYLCRRPEKHHVGIQCGDEVGPLHKEPVYPGIVGKWNGKRVQRSEPDEHPLPASCSKPSSEVGFWGAAVGLVVDKSELEAAVPENAVAPAFTDEDCGPSVMEAGCTASLIGPKHVLTAKHCFNHAEHCKAEPVLVDHKILLMDYFDSPETATKIDGLRVVACGGTESGRQEDEWLVLELPEPITDRCPLILPGPEDTPPLCEPLYALGYPLGHPIHRVGSDPDVAASAWVTQVDESTPPDGPTFYTTLDTMDSMSGAPIFDMRGHLLGMLVRGKYKLTKPGDPEMCTIQICPSVGCGHADDYVEAITLAHISEYLAGLAGV